MTAAVPLDAILALLGGDVQRVLGRRDRVVTHPAPLSDAPAGSITFCSRRVTDPLPLIRASAADVVVCGATVVPEPDDHRERTLVLVAEPRLAFIRIVREFFKEPDAVGVHGTAVIHPGAVLHEPVSIGPFCHVEDDVEIGPHTVLLSHVTVHAHTRIGRRVRINSGSVIGTEGFGYERNADGVLEKFHHVGGLVIEDDIEIGAQVVVNRGTLANTVIGEGTKINNLVNVGHNVVIGRHSFVAVGSILGGSSRLGEFCWLGPAAVVRNGVTVGHHVTIGMGAVVVKDVADGLVVVGIPARPMERRGP